MLKKVVVIYKVKNFVVVVKLDDFKFLDFDKVKDLIFWDDIIVFKEEEVYDVVIMWVKYDFLLRECLFFDLLKCVRIFLMLKYSFWEIFCKEEFVLNSFFCVIVFFKVLDVFFFFDSF